MEVDKWCESKRGNASSDRAELEDGALLHLLRHVQQEGYRFTAVTPATHERVLARPAAGPASLRDIFGWNRTFDSGDLDEDLFRTLLESGLVSRTTARWRSEVRVSSLGSDLFLHSRFPTEERDAVFFGPDTYRFARFVEDELGTVEPGTRIVDMGAGSGAGGLTCARLSPDAKIRLVDLNPEALRFARLNAAAAGIDVEIEKRNTVPSGAHILVANPPYMVDSARREYRDGGDLLGGAVALDWVRQALGSLRPGGRMLLYTGVAMVEAQSPALAAIKAECERRAADYRCYEIDPDVFGEELSSPAYAEVERIAAVGCVLTLPN
jgi:methylase of polypeptide subunit release factors